MTRALVWRSPDGEIGWFVDDLHPGHLDERLSMWRVAFPELQTGIVEVDIVPTTIEARSFADTREGGEHDD